MNILALDLGSTTGYAFQIGGGNAPLWGSESWATKDTLKREKQRRLDRRGDCRVIAFFKWLQDFNRHHSDIFVVFEDVEFQSYRMQAQLWASFRTAVWLTFPSERVEAVNVQTLKKFATGKGGADKEAMKKALKARHPEIFSIAMDDNAIDAVWLWLWGKENLGRSK